MKDTRPTTKKCPRCLQTKDREMFHKSLTRLDRMGTYCKACEKSFKQIRKDNNKQYDMYGII